MFNTPTSLTEFIREEEAKIDAATGEFTLLLLHIEHAAKIIGSHIRKTGLSDILGVTGAKNASEDEVKRIDEYSNQLLVDTLCALPQVYAVASEEMDDFVYANKNGKYIVFFDPLDGSSNIDANITIGTIFSIYHKGDELLQPGSKQLAAGYILYGTSMVFVYTCGQGVNEFTFDPGIGSFLLSHPKMKIPDKGTIYSINGGYDPFWDESTRKYISYLKQDDPSTNRPYKLRYVGSMVADVHRTLIQGGIFLYPKDRQKPHGKLRLQFEANPISFLVSQAGGLSLSNNTDPLTIVPTSLHQKVPLVVGSPQEVKTYQTFL